MRQSKLPQDIFDTTIKSQEPIVPLNSPPKKKDSPSLMEMHPILLRYSAWPLFFFHLQRSPSPPPNYVHWTETPTSHLYAANLPGLRKEEIRVEVEDSLYMVIRTELCNTGIGTEEEQEEEKEERMRQRSFNRKFRLPVRVDLEGITARYEDGVLTVTVPRLIRRPQIECSGLDQEVKSVARAA